MSHDVLHPLGVADEGIDPAVPRTHVKEFGVPLGTKGVVSECTDLGVATLIESYHLWSQIEL